MSVSLDGDPSELDFTTVEVGSSLVGAIVVVVPADATTTLTIAVAGSAFSASPTGTVSTSSRTTIGITFAPPAATSYTGTLTIAWSVNGENGTQTLALRGVGVADDDEDDDDAITSTESYQRAVLYVPTYESLVALGAAYAPDGVTLTQPGFTASTTRHVFFRAAKSMTFQADGHAWFQSNEGALYTVAGGNAYLIGGEAVYVGSGGYCGFMAGYVGEPVDARKDDYSDADPSRPAPVDDISKAFAAADLSWKIVNQLVAIAVLAKTWEQKVYLGEHKSLMGAFGLAISTVTTTWGLGAFLYGEAVGTADKTTNFYSEAGILAGTPAFCTMASTFGVTYRSLNVSVLAPLYASIEGCLTASIDSIFGETSIASGRAISSRSLLENKFASRLGTLSLYGLDVEIGGLTSDGFQAPTASIAMNALTSLVIEATAPAIGAITVKASPPLPGASIDASAAVQASFTSAKNTNIRVISIANVYEIVASPSSISIRSAAGELIKLGPAMITLGPSFAQVKILQQLADIGGGAFKITPAGVTAMSGTLDLL